MATYKYCDHADHVDEEDKITFVPAKCTIRVRYHEIGNGTVIRTDSSWDVCDEHVGSATQEAWANHMRPFFYDLVLSEIAKDEDEGDAS